MPIDPRLRELIGQTTFWDHLGFELLDAEVGHVRMRLPMADFLDTVGGRGIIHGGAIATLIDSAAGAAVRTTRGVDEPPWVGMASTDLTVSFLAAATSDVIADARVLRVGGRTAFVDGQVHDANGDLVSVGRVTVAIRRS